jgi:nucleoside-diphosphate-sugar epimerase
METQNKKFKKILVTGGAGYVGSILTDELLKRGYEVRVIDNLRFGWQSVLPFISNPNYEFIKGDVRDAAAMQKAVDGVDAVVHLAAIVGFPACRKDPELSRDINVNGMQTLVDTVHGRIPILFASTGSTYGKMIEDLCTETTPLNPLSNYGKQKAEAEDIVKKNAEFVIYRFATAFGVSPRMRLDLLPNDFSYRAVKDRSLIVYEKDFMRTFVHVRDMAASFIFALEHYDKVRGQIYNVGDNGMNYSKEAICQLIQKRVDYYLHFADVGHDADQRDYVVSYDKLNNAGFRTSVSMEQGIAELVKAAHIIEVQNPLHNV